MTEGITTLCVDDNVHLLAIGQLFPLRPGDISIPLSVTLTIQLVFITHNFDTRISDNQMPWLDEIEFLKYFHYIEDCRFYIKKISSKVLYPKHTLLHIS